MPSNCAPSRSVVSKMSTAAGTATSPASAGRAGPGGAAGCPASCDMFDPFLVPIDLSAHDPAVLLADRERHRARTGQLPVVHRPDRRHLGRGPAHERLLGDVEVAARQLALADGEAEVA